MRLHNYILYKHGIMVNSKYKIKDETRYELGLNRILPDQKYAQHRLFQIYSDLLLDINTRSGLMFHLQEYAGRLSAQ